MRGYVLKGWLWLINVLMINIFIANVSSLLYKAAATAMKTKYFYAALINVSVAFTALNSPQSSKGPVLIDLFVFFILLLQLGWSLFLLLREVRYTLNRSAVRHRKTSPTSSREQPHPFWAYFRISTESNVYISGLQWIGARKLIGEVQLEFKPEGSSCETTGPTALPLFHLNCSRSSNKQISRNIICKK